MKTIIDIFKPRGFIGSSGMPPVEQEHERLLKILQEGSPREKALAAAELIRLNDVKRDIAEQIGNEEFEDMDDEDMQFIFDALGLGRLPDDPDAEDEIVEAHYEDILALEDTLDMHVGEASDAVYTYLMDLADELPG